MSHSVVSGLSTPSIGFYFALVFLVLLVNFKISFLLNFAISAVYLLYPTHPVASKFQIFVCLV